jgi:predicted GNAT family N-acyltransferase
MKLQVIITQDPKHLEKALSIRRRVFIEEQNVPEELENDEYDHHIDTRHVLVIDHQGDALGTARFHPYENGTLKIERVAVLAEQRGTGAGRMIMETIEAEARKAGYHSMKLGAQLHAGKFYERLGFQSYGQVYLDAGIEHIDMIKRF